MSRLVTGLGFALLLVGAILFMIGFLDRADLLARVGLKLSQAAATWLGLIILAAGGLTGFLTLEIGDNNSIDTSVEALRKERDDC